MSLGPDHIADRRRLKRSLFVWRLAAIVAGAALVIALIGRFSEFGGGHYVARLQVDGIITDDAKRATAMRRVAEDAKARALVVRFNSPGGTVVGGETLFAGLRHVAGKKPVVAVLGEVATSAAYMGAIGADRIVARPGSLTGSIGVILQTADITGLLDKIGVKPEVIKSSPLKAQPNPLEPFTEPAREAARAVVVDLYEAFVDMVAERRGLPRPEARRLADGRIYSGRQALANGLIDALGGEAEARQWLADSFDVAISLDVRDVDIDDETSLWRRLLDEVSGKTLFSERLKLDGLVSLWHPDSW